MSTQINITTNNKAFARRSFIDVAGYHPSVRRGHNLALQQGLQLGPAALRDAAQRLQAYGKALDKLVFHLDPFLATEITGLTRLAFSCGAQPFMAGSVAGNFVTPAMVGDVKVWDGSLNQANANSLRGDFPTGSFFPTDCITVFLPVRPSALASQRNVLSLSGGDAFAQVGKTSDGKLRCGGRPSAAGGTTYTAATSAAAIGTDWVLLEATFDWTGNRLVGKVNGTEVINLSPWHATSVALSGSGFKIFLGGDGANQWTGMFASVSAFRRLSTREAGEVRAAILANNPQIVV